jgi:hypothetical protein
MKKTSRIFNTLLRSLACGMALLGCLAGESVGELGTQGKAAGKGGDVVAFSKDVWPILQARCVACHSADRSEGDLRFDSGRGAVEEGGHTGRPILGTSAGNSEFIRRITSTKAGYRMPKKGTPLSDSEVAILTQWIDGGAKWEETPKVDSNAADKSSAGDRVMTLADRVVWFESQMKNPGFSGLVYLSIVFCVTMIGAFFVLRKTQLNGPWLSRLKTILILVLGFLCVATYIHYDAKYKDALAKTESVQTQLLTYTGPPGSSHALSAPYPMHPPRLGGVYYRGNDERDPQLFNGGFYRTAQLEVWLTDRDGTHLQWDDVPEGALYIDFVIKRAANTTGELFNDHVMSVVGLSDDVNISAAPNSDDAAGRMTIGNVLPMETIQPDQVWRCRYSIGTAEAPVKTVGKVFLVQNTSKPKAHYAVDFKIDFDSSGAITQSSQLWMGSLYNLNGRVLVPHDNQKILLDRWFDFRPIPEISGTQTDDPVLLGIPEHQ